jgi:hypothetical protein
MSNIKLENILLKFAIRVLDVSNGKGNPTLGEMIDEPAAEIEELYGVSDDDGIYGTEEQYERAEQLRDGLREDGVA